MRKRRFTHVSDDDDYDEDKAPLSRKMDNDGDGRRNRKKKLRVDDDEMESESGSQNQSKKGGGGGLRGGGGDNGGGGEAGEEEEEVVVAFQEDAKPIGPVARVSGRGKGKKIHYEAFEYDGNEFTLEDPVLLTPDDTKAKPYVAIIKDITQHVDGSMWVTGQWFYRPEEAERKGGGKWEARDTRELFYSFHVDDVPAESVMHKCVVHFVPLNKKLPIRSQNPGFIVQKVYDTVEKKLWKLTDKDYEDTKQHEIDLLVQKTRERIGELPDIEPEDPPPDQTDSLTIKRSLRKKPVQPIDVSRVDDLITRTDMKAETPGSCTTDVSEYRAILTKFKALTGDNHRDKWLDKLLLGIKAAFPPKDDSFVEDKKFFSAASQDENASTINESVTSTVTRDNGSSGGENICWPDTAVWAITALERAAHEALGADFQKYNQKMRQLDFNLKNNLAKRLLNKELDPVVIVNMAPHELKEGLTTEEKTDKEPEETKHMQMTDARCPICSEKKVGIADIIQGGQGDRYQLECTACGHSYFTSRDAISSLTLDATSVAGNVGTAPWATAKFEAVEKALVSPRESEKAAAFDVYQKSTAAYIPVLEAPKSLNRPKAEDAPVPVVP